MRKAKTDRLSDTLMQTKFTIEFVAVVNEFQNNIQGIIGSNMNKGLIMKILKNGMLNYK